VPAEQVAWVDEVAVVSLLHACHFVWVPEASSGRFKQLNGSDVMWVCAARLDLCVEHLARGRLGRRSSRTMRTDGSATWGWLDTRISHGDVRTLIHAQPGGTRRATGSMSWTDRVLLWSNCGDRGSGLNDYPTARHVMYHPS
jgi:hypothetical protein